MSYYLDARDFSGPVWLRTLFIELIIVSVIYLLVHGSGDKGNEYRQLDTVQIQHVNNIVSYFPDTETRSLILITDNDVAAKAKELRTERNKMLESLLSTEFENSLDTDDWKELAALFMGMNSKETADYLAAHKIKIRGYFFLTGSKAYLEVVLWTLVGVLISLIYYVAIANGNSMRKAGNDDTGEFDIAEIPGQIAKMFYAPVCALVLVLGYSFFAGSNKMVDISVSKGVILFSFIAGFYSGRVMKFIDGLKNVLLPLSAGDDSAPPAENKSNSLTTKLAITDTVAAALTAEGVTLPPLNTADVQLTSEDGATTIALNKPAGAEGAYTADKIPFGKYDLSATLTATKTDAATNTASEIKLAAKKNIEVNGSKQEYSLELEKEAG